MWSKFIYLFLCGADLGGTCPPTPMCPCPTLPMLVICILTKKFAFMIINVQNKILT